MMLAIQSNRWEAFAQLIALILILVFVIALCFVTTRLVGNYQKNKLSGSNITVLETLRVSNTKYIQIIKIADRCIAVSVCKDTMNYLCDVNEEELVYRDISSKNDNSKLAGISNFLKGASFTRKAPDSNSTAVSEDFESVLDKYKRKDDNTEDDNTEVDNTEASDNSEATNGDK